MIAQLLAGGINTTFTIRFATIVRLGDENSDKKKQEKNDHKFPRSNKLLTFCILPHCSMTIWNSLTWL